ncbi:MAG: DUF4065 domain-containing protein [Minwuiales bacterium]|nr:DUF4065 domain-containing protein [Minwuiales bacterium]
MPYPAASIANAFLKLARERGGRIDPMKIQKLCYLAHGYYLVENNGAPLFDEKFEAWRFGPVLPSLYHAAKSFGRRVITKPFNDFDYETRIYVRAPEPTDPEVLEIVEFVWDNYGDMPAMKLSDWTHENGGPWDTVIKEEKNFIRNMDISDDLIADYFNRTMYDDSAQET